MPAKMSADQTSYSRGPTSVLRHYRALNIVQRLSHQALTGRGLGITVHQHYGYRIHYELRGEFGSLTFEWRYPSYTACNRVCVAMVRGYPEGLSNCVLMCECLSVYGSLEYAGRYWQFCVGATVNSVLATFSVWSPRPVLWLDEMRLGPWPALDEDDGLSRREEDSPSCRCTVISPEGTFSSFYEGINSLWYMSCLLICVRPLVTVLSVFRVLGHWSSGLQLRTAR